MSQNTIISVVLIFLAIIFGVYFINSEPISQEVDYSGDGTKKSSVDGVLSTDSKTDSEGVADSNSSDVSSESSTDTENVDLTESSTEDSTMTTNTSDSTDVPEVQTTDEVEIVDEAVETGNKVITYNIAISGAQSSFAKAFSIVATDSDGRKEEFTQKTLVDGIYKIKAEKRMVSFSIDAEGYAPVLKEISTMINLGASITIEIELEPLAGFTGNIKSFNGIAVGGAVIKISKGVFKKRAYGNTKGEFKFTDLSSGEYELKIIHPQFDTKTLTASLVKGEVKEVIVKLNRNAILFGNLLDEEGQAANGVKITLSPVDIKDKASTALSGANGEFKFDDIITGNYELKVSSLKGQLSEKISFHKNLVISKNFKLTPPPSISGVIVNTKGKPVSGVKLFTFDDKTIIECVSKKDGRFRLPLAKQGKYRILSSSSKMEINNNIKLYVPGTTKIVLQIIEKKYLRGKVQTSSGIDIDKNYLLKIKNKKTGREKKVIVYEINNGVFSIPMSLFRYVSKTDYIQIVAESKDFGRGESLSFKFDNLNLDKNVMITLGD
ncbi:MAG: hypothetical protein COA79_16435 [Planctomycetota bacterium]|nr:MAG: hypothetical protein COA79_16435 [Planctomycetota bacterium]